MNASFSKDVWTAFTSYRFPESAEQQIGPATYIPWGLVWQVAKSLYPASNYVQSWEVVPTPRGNNVMCQTAVTISDGENEITHVAHLPVLGKRGSGAAINPDAFAIHNALQRCLVKALAFHGLGLYLWTGGEELGAGVTEDGSTAEAPTAELLETANAGAAVADDEQLEWLIKKGYATDTGQGVRINPNCPPAVISKLAELGRD